MFRVARTLATLALMLGLVFAPGLTGDAHAGRLDDAKAAGYVGEKPDGYLGIVDASAPAKAKTLIDKVNAKRRDKYQGIADDRGTTLEAVEKLVGEKLIKRAKPGEYIMNASGKWVQK